MNMYRILGDRVGTHEARDLAQRLVRWHDAMVKHLRVSNRHLRDCPEGCPHEEARGLWSAAMDLFGEQAGALQFLQRHGGASPHRADAPLEVHA